MRNNGICLKHQIKTEKSHKMFEKLGVYVFIVNKDATKRFVKSDIETIFSVKVKKINIVSMPEKFKSFKGTKGFESGYKKAYITLLPGMKIDFEDINVVK